MADLNQIQLPNGVTYDIKDNTKLPISTAGGIASCSGGGSNWYYHIATIVITTTYMNRPVVFEISGRNKQFSRLQLQFINSNTTDPALQYFSSDGDNEFYIKKTTTSTWEVYGKYSEQWGMTVLHRITGAGADIGITVVMSNIGTTLPTDTTQATYIGNVAYATNAGTVNGHTVAKDVPSNAVFTDNNTTYTFANGTNGFTVTPSGGSAQTVTVTPSIANNVTGSGTSGCIAKFNGTNTVTDGPAFGSSITNFLAENGQWRTPANDKVRQNYIEDTTEKYYMPLLGEHDATYSEYSTTETVGTKKAIGLNYCISDGYYRTLKISATNGSQTQSVELRPFGASKIPTLQVPNSITTGSIYSEGSISSDSNIGCDGTVSANSVSCKSISANSVTLPHQYSETEQIVGYWIDGSPVYEITKYELSSGSGIQVPALGTANLMDWTTPIQPISFKGYRYVPTGSSRFYTCWEHMGGQWQASTNKLQCYNSANHARNINGFTMQYIKI